MKNCKFTLHKMIIFTKLKTEEFRRKWYKLIKLFPFYLVRGRQDAVSAR